MQHHCNTHPLNLRLDSVLTCVKPKGIVGCWVMPTGHCLSLHPLAIVEAFPPSVFRGEIPFTESQNPHTMAHNFVPHTYRMKVVCFDYGFVCCMLLVVGVRCWWCSNKQWSRWTLWARPIELASLSLCPLFHSQTESAKQHSKFDSHIF